MALPERVTVTEVGPRDGLQNEERILDLATKAEMIDRLGATGLRRIEAASFVSPKAIPQMRDAQELVSSMTRRSGITYIALVPNEIGARNAIAGEGRRAGDRRLRERDAQPRATSTGASTNRWPASPASPNWRATPACRGAATSRRRSAARTRARLRPSA